LGSWGKWSLKKRVGVIDELPPTLTVHC
jgi:hypothetical protein